MLAVQIDLTETIIWALVTLALFVVLGFGVLIYRRRYLSPRSEQSEGFSLEDIRQMHRSGQLSDEEYDRMRRALIGMATRDAED